MSTTAVWGPLNQTNKKDKTRLRRVQNVSNVGRSHI